MNKKYLQIVFCLSMYLGFMQKSHADVIVIDPELKICSGSDFVVLDDIVIQEQLDDDFQDSGGDRVTLILTLSEALKFEIDFLQNNTITSNIEVTPNGNILLPNISIQNTPDGQKIEITFEVDNTISRLDFLKIKGLMIKPIPNISGSVFNLLQTDINPNSADIEGIQGENFATLRVGNTLPLFANASPDRINNGYLNIELCESDTSIFNFYNFSNSQVYIAEEVNPITNPNVINIGDVDYFKFAADSAGIGTSSLYLLKKSNICSYSQILNIEINKGPEVAFKYDVYHSRYTISDQEIQLPPLNSPALSFDMLSDLDPTVPIQISDYCGSRVFRSGGDYFFSNDIDPDENSSLDCSDRSLGGLFSIFRFLFQPTVQIEVENPNTGCATRVGAYFFSSDNNPIIICPNDNLVTVNLDLEKFVDEHSNKDIQLFLWGSDIGLDTCFNSSVSSTNLLGSNTFSIDENDFDISIDIDVSNLDRTEENFLLYVYSNPIDSDSCNASLLETYPLLFQDFGSEADISIEGLCEGSRLEIIDTTPEGLYNNTSSSNFEFTLTVRELVSGNVIDISDGLFSTFGNCSGANDCIENRLKGIWTNPRAGNYEATLEIHDVTGNNSKLCIAPVTKRFTVSPVVSVSANLPYFEDFEQDDGEWKVLENSLYPSWQWGQASGRLTTPERAENKIYATNLIGPYNALEQSYLMPACLDIRGLDRPKLAMKAYFETPENIDGFYVEASRNNGKTWERIGNSTPSGLNWYTSENVVAVPPDTMLNREREAWSGESGTWITLAHGLDNFKELEPNVKSLVLRIGFSSILENPFYAGIGIDSFWVGNRNKNVMFEWATNAPANVGNWETIKEASYEVKSRSSIFRDVNFFQYHLGFPLDDPIFNHNTDPPSALALQNSISTSNAIFLDGIPFQKDLLELGRDISINSLKAPEFLIENIQYTNTSDAYITFSLEANVNLSKEELTAQIAVVDPQYTTESNSPFGVDTFNFVLADMLPDAGGIFLNKSWTVGEELTIEVPKVRDFPKFNYDSVGVLIWIKNIHTNEVYQSAYKGPLFEITEDGKRDGLFPASPYTLNLHPNPTKHKLFLSTGIPLDETLDVQIFNMLGKLHQKLSLELGRDLYPIPINDLPSGLYEIQVSNKGMLLTREKIQILD